MYVKLGPLIKKNKKKKRRKKKKKRKHNILIIGDYNLSKLQKRVVDCYTLFTIYM